MGIFRLFNAAECEHYSTLFFIKLESIRYLHYWNESVTKTLSNQYQLGNTRGLSALTSEYLRINASASTDAGCPTSNLWWHQCAVGCGRLTPTHTHTSGCNSRFLVNSRELTGLLLLLACITSAISHRNHLDLAKVARSNWVTNITISMAAV